MNLSMNTSLYKKAYASKFNPMTSKDQWLHVDLGYKINKPKLRRKPGRPSKSRIKPFDDVGTSKKKRCVLNAMN